MKIHGSADLEAARERGAILDEKTTQEQADKATGQFYYFDCLDAISSHFYAVELFEDLKEARRIAYDHEAILTEHTFINGERTGQAIEHTRYMNQGTTPYNGDIFAEDIQQQIDKEQEAQ